MKPLKPRGIGLRRLDRADAASVDLLTAELVKIGTLAADRELPALVEPAGEEIDLAEWAGAHRDLLEERLSRHGAVLLRGFDVSTPLEFERVAAAACPDLFGDYGDLPKEELGEKLYQSTPYPPNKTILFHNESSHTPRWPLRQLFYCAQPAAAGGETPIVDCREIYRRLDAGLRSLFAERGLRYLRNFTPGIDVSWQSFFKTDDRSAVESYCRENGVELRWREDGGLATWQRAPAVARHPTTGEEVFFNQLQLHHVACLDAEVRASMRELFADDDLPRHVTFGDGSPIDDAIVAEVCDLYWRCSVAFPWQRGDVLMVDNMLVAHARNPFEGERKIVVAMGRMLERRDLEASTSTDG